MLQFLQCDFHLWQLFFVYDGDVDDDDDDGDDDDDDVNDGDDDNVDDDDDDETDQAEIKGRSSVDGEGEGDIHVSTGIVASWAVISFSFSQSYSNNTEREPSWKKGQSPGSAYIISISMRIDKCRSIL